MWSIEKLVLISTYICLCTIIITLNQYVTSQLERWESKPTFAAGTSGLSLASILAWIIFSPSNLVNVAKLKRWGQYCPPKKQLLLSIGTSIARNSPVPDHRYLDTKDNNDSGLENEQPSKQTHLTIVSDLFIGWPRDHQIVKVVCMSKQNSCSLIVIRQTICERLLRGKIEDCSQCAIVIGWAKEGFTGCLTTMTNVIMQQATFARVIPFQPCEKIDFFKSQLTVGYFGMAETVARIRPIPGAWLWFLPAAKHFFPTQLCVFYVARVQSECFDLLGQPN